MLQPQGRSFAASTGRTSAKVAPLRTIHCFGPCMRIAVERLEKIAAFTVVPFAFSFMKITVASHVRTSNEYLLAGYDCESCPGFPRGLPPHHSAAVFAEAAFLSQRVSHSFRRSTAASCSAAPMLMSCASRFFIRFASVFVIGFMCFIMTMIVLCASEYLHG